MHLWELDKNHQAVPADNVYQWAESFERDHRVAGCELNGLFVSTIFLGVDHNFGFGGPPLLFETMIFPGENPPENFPRIQEWASTYQVRYSTWEQAMSGHENVVRIIREGLF